MSMSMGPIHGVGSAATQAPYPKQIRSANDLSLSSGRPAAARPRLTEKMNEKATERSESMRVRFKAWPSMGAMDLRVMNETPRSP
jgi:hypothetical protein